MCAVWKWEFRQISEDTQFFRMELDSRTEPCISETVVMADFFSSDSEMFSCERSDNFYYNS